MTRNWQKLSLLFVAVTLAACTPEQADFDSGKWARAKVQRVDGEPCWIMVAIDYPGKLYHAKIEGCEQSKTP